MFYPKFTKSAICRTPDTWNKITHNLGNREYAIGCPIGGVAYVGLGNWGGGDFWRFIPECSLDLILNNTYMIDRAYQTSNTIITEGNFAIPSAHNLTLSAGTSIKLKPGFRANEGSNFKAKVQPCTQTASARIRSVMSATQDDSLLKELDNNRLNAYPNPTSGKTTITYSVHEKGFVSLYLKDNLGNQTINLITNEFLEPGKYEIDFDSKELGAGVYFYTLIADGIAINKRLALLK